MMIASKQHDKSRRPPFWLRMPIWAGNTVQLAGMALGGWLLYLAAHVYASAAACVGLMILGWLSVYLCCHSLAHWLVGRLVGIHFTEYGVRGTDHPDELNPVLRAVLSRLPMFTAVTQRESMQRASLVAKALMFAAGETSTIVCTVLSGLYAWVSNIPGGLIFFVIAVLMSAEGVISTSRIPRGDLAKARRALRGE